MLTRTTIMLDDDSRRAAKELAAQLDVSASEVIRRALVHYRDGIVGVPPEARRRRMAAFERLMALFEGHDAEAEIRRLKSEDAHW
jgi:predicted transcriptional regulator